MRVLPRLTLTGGGGPMSTETLAGGARFSMLSPLAGPFVEGWLSIRGDMIEDDMVRLNTETHGKLRQPCGGGDGGGEGR